MTLITSPRYKNKLDSSNCFQFICICFTQSLCYKKGDVTLFKGCILAITETDKDMFDMPWSYFPCTVSKCLTHKSLTANALQSKASASPPDGCILRVMATSFLLYPDTVSSLEFPSATSQELCVLFSSPLLPPSCISDYNLGLKSNLLSTVFLVWTPTYFQIFSSSPV